jgi:hydroxymethylpyrimidine pyrophosphatase-like HAD family hydrolase
MDNKILFFTDIDDTLIQTKRKTDFNLSCEVAGLNRESNPHSYIYSGVKEFVDSLIDSGVIFIPTTARNYESYSRTIFKKNSRISNYILNFGAEVYINNTLDEVWNQRILDNYSQIDLDLILNETINLLSEFELNIKSIDNYYISIHNKKGQDDNELNSRLDSILKEFLSTKSNFYLYRNDNSFAILPNFLNKSFAVEYILSKYKPLLTIGAGDNINDLHFMDRCHFQLMPTIHTKFKRR